MPVQSCPKCQAKCELSDEALSLGFPFRCQCGCAFELYPGVASTKPVTKPSSAQTTSPDPKRAETYTNRSTAPQYRPTGRRHSGSDISFVVVIAVAFGAAFLLFKSGWLFSLLLLSLFGTLLCVHKKLVWKLRDSKSGWHFFFEKSLEFFVPLGIATLSFLLLSLVVNGMANEADLLRLESLESFLGSVKSGLTWLMPKWWLGTIVIFSLLTIDLLLTIYGKSSTLATTYKTTQKWIKRAYVLAAMLCSFTFFGSDVGQRRAELSVRAEKIKGGYSQIRDEVEAALRDTVQIDLYEKIRGSFPEDVQQVHDYPKDIADAVRSLRENYQTAKEYKVADPQVAELLKRYEEADRRPPTNYTEPIKYSDLPTESLRSNTPTSQTRATTAAAVERVPVQVSEKSIGRTLKELRASTSRRQRFVELLRLDSTKALLCQFPKSFTGAIKSAAFTEVIKTYPMVGPVVDILVGAFDQEMEKKVKASADKIAEALIKDPEFANQMIEAEATKLSDAAEVRPSNGVLNKMKTFAATIKAQLAELRNADTKISDMVAEARDRESETTTELFDPQPFGEEKEKDSDPMVDCYCLKGGTETYVGRMRKSACHGVC